MQDAFIGQKIGSYRIIERIGHGGMSEVFKACCAADGGFVALKLLHSFHLDDPSFIYRFTREARVLAELDHPNIVRVFSFDMRGSNPYIAMEYVGGGTLKDRFKQLRDEQRIMPFSDSLRIILELSDALAYAHSRGLIHRDIKPANILFDDNARAVLSDFGIVKTINNTTQHTQTGAMLGTPAYMSPEQGLGRTGDARSDVYALGVLFFQMMTGELPFDADKPLAVVLKHINEPVPLPSALNAAVPDPIEAIILTALAKGPQQRFQTAREMANEIRHAVRKSGEPWARAIPPHLLINRRHPPLALRSDEDEIASAVAPPPSAPQLNTENEDSEVIVVPTATSEPRRQPWLIALLLLALLLSGSLLGSRFLLDRNATTAPPVSTAALIDDDDAKLIAAASPTTAATATRANALLPTPQPTQTAAPSLTPSSPPLNAGDAAATATIEALVNLNATAIYLASCDHDAELLDFYPTGAGDSGIRVGDVFTMNWRLRNSGICQLPPQLRFVPGSGENFGAGDGVAMPMLAPGEEVLISAGLTAPASAGSYTTSWQLVDSAGNRIATPITFSIDVIESAARPEQPLDISAYIQTCDYLDSQWRCLILLTPTGGSGRYTIRVAQGDEVSEFVDVGEQLYLISAPRCSAWASNVSAEDSTTAERVTRSAVIDPADDPVSTLLGDDCSAEG